MNRYTFSWESAGVQNSRQDYWTSYRSMVAAHRAAKRHREKHGGLHYRIRDNRTNASWPAFAK